MIWQRFSITNLLKPLVRLPAGCLLLIAVHASAASFGKAQVTAIDTAILGEMAKQEAVGAALGIIRGGRIVYLKGYGLADREQEIQVTTNTMFRWASISKPLTAVVTMQLFEAGKLKLRQHVREFVPEFPDKGTPIRIGQLLRHQGGIRHYRNGEVLPNNREYSSPHPFADVIVALDEFKASPLIAEPGQKYSYSTHGYILLSAVVQRAGRAKFADQVRNKIAAPLGMDSLQPDYQWVKIPNRAVGYRKQDGKVIRDTDTDVSWKLGGGGYISTVGDLARFAEGLINRRLVSEDTERLMWMHVTPKNGKRPRMAHGFSVEGKGTDLKVYHSGSQEKAKTRMVIYPRKKHGVVFMSNSRHVNPGDFTTAVYRALTDAE